MVLPFRSLDEGDVREVQFQGRKDKARIQAYEAHDGGKRRSGGVGKIDGSELSRRAAYDREERGGRPGGVRCAPDRAYPRGRWQCVAWICQAEGYCEKVIT